MSDKEQVYVVVSDVENCTNKAYAGLVEGAVKKYIFDLNFETMFGGCNTELLEKYLEEYFVLVDRVDMFAGSNTVVIRVL